MNDRVIVVHFHILAYNISLQVLSVGTCKYRLFTKHAAETLKKMAKGIFVSFEMLYTICETYES